MQTGHSLHFKCVSCGADVQFSIFELEGANNLPCRHCEQRYSFSDPILKRQLKKFEALCCKIVEAEEILGNACIGIDVGEHHVKVPYKLLLTRLSSSLDLNIDGHKLSVSFRIEPGHDPYIAKAVANKMVE